MTSQTRSNPWAHPRVSGENSAIDAKAAALGGSSPRERGKPYLKPAGKDSWGLIPA